jgi:integrase
MTVETEARRVRRQGLTDKQIAELPRERKRYTKTDPEQRALYLRVPPTGPIVFAVAERNNYGTKKWAKIGTTADMDIATARDRARTVIRRIKDGLPAFEPPPRQPDTYRAVVEQWLELHVKKEGLRSHDEIKRLLDRHVLPFWGKRDFVDIKRRDINDLLDAIAKDSAWNADHVLAVIRKTSAWFATRDNDYVSPFVTGMRRTKKEDRERDRILDEDELRKVWKVAKTNGPFGALVQLLLLTAQRRDKVVTMKWDDIKDGGVWEIASEPREKGNAGALRLPAAALAIVEAQPRVKGNPYVFAASRGDGPLNGFNKRKAAFDKACGVTGWALHDLRRSARSLMSGAGVLSEHAERVLGHKQPGVEAIYDRYPYLEEKSAALIRLAAKIDNIVNPPADNVTPFPVQAS